MYGMNNSGLYGFGRPMRTARPPTRNAPPRWRARARPTGSPTRPTNLGNPAAASRQNLANAMKSMY